MPKQTQNSMAMASSSKCVWSSTAKVRKSLPKSCCENAYSPHWILFVVVGITGGPEIVFSVKNSVPSDSGITKETLQDLLKNFLAPGKSNFARNKSPAEQGGTKVTKDSTSTQAGLPHIHLACQGAGGSFNLKLDDDGRVVCAITLPAQLISRYQEKQEPTSRQGFCDSAFPQSTRSSSSDARGRFDRQIVGPSAQNATPSKKNEMPENLKISVIDDSSVKCLHFSTADHLNSI
jgi:hypothetical protein